MQPQGTAGTVPDPDRRLRVAHPGSGKPRLDGTRKATPARGGFRVAPFACMVGGWKRTAIGDEGRHGSVPSF